MDFAIERIEILQEVSFGDECWFKTLSPIYVKTMRKENEDLREIDLYPTEPKFYENLHRNLVERFSEFYDKAPIDHFDVIETADIKPKRIKIAEGYRRCTLMSLRIQASPELLKFAYEAGLGEKNAMGFGCMILNLLSDAKIRLYRLSHFFEDKPMPLIFPWKPDIVPSNFTEERAGNVLDEFYRSNPQKIFSMLTHSNIKLYNINTNSIRVDTTSKSFYGAAFTSCLLFLSPISTAKICELLIGGIFTGVFIQPLPATIITARRIVNLNKLDFISESHVNYICFNLNKLIG